MNHASNVEPPIVFNALHELFPKLRILYKAELRKLPVLGRAFDLAGFVPLERANREQSLPAIDRAAEALASRELVPDLPRRHAQPRREPAAVQEGGVHPGHQGTGAGRPGRDHRGPRRHAQGQPVHPPRPRAGPFGEPIETVGMTLDDRDTLATLVHQRVQALLTR